MKIITKYCKMIDRIAKFIERQDISVSAFEKTIGASDGMIRRAIKNKTDIQAKWICAISDNYPNLNLNWLITGNGEMIINMDVDVVAESQAKYVKSPINNREKDLEQTIEAQKRTIETQQEIINLLKTQLSEQERDAPGAEVADVG